MSQPTEHHGGAKTLPDFRTYDRNDVSPEEALDLFERTRAQCPVAHSEKLGGFYALLGHGEVKQAMSDWKSFSSLPNTVRPLVDRPQLPPIDYDPPQQTSWRRLIRQAFNEQTPGRHEDSVRAEAVRLIDSFAGAGSCDLVADFAEQLPLFTLCEVIGFDPEQRAELRRRALEMVARMDDPEEGARASGELAEWGIQAVMRRRAEPRDDFLTALGQAEIDGKPLTVEEIGTAMNSILLAGHSTTVGGLGFLFYEVLKRPEVRQKLIDEPGRIGDVVEETLRLHTPVFGLFRTATKPVKIGGQEIPEGASVCMLWAAANRDPAVFEDPNTFNLDRERSRNKRSLTFGHGIHACVGAATARMELRVALEELLSRLPDIELVDPESVRSEFAGVELCAIRSLPATFTPS